MPEEKNAKENISENKVLLNDEDNNAAAGFMLAGSARHCMDLSQAEFSALKEGGFIVDGKLKNKNCHEASKYLQSKGFKGRFMMGGLYNPLVDYNKIAEEPADIRIGDD